VRTPLGEDKGDRVGDRSAAVDPIVRESFTKVDAPMYVGDPIESVVSGTSLTST